ncbi:hypothetical protein HYT91_00140 [Candidatus Pacearchaeota archaeon]|nr:hypothetical protein [Candidatus Pacearchaeota archaeon]
MVEKNKMKRKQKMKEEGLLNHNYKIIKQDKKFLFLIFAGLFIVYSFLFGLWKIPVLEFGIYRMSAAGIWDYLFIFGTSVLISIFVVLWRHERKIKAQSFTAFGVAGGGFAAVLAGICPVCQSLALVAFGATFLNIPTAFLTPYLGILKIVSMGLLILVVHLKANSIYTKTCKFCLIQDSKKGKK